jgi:hypothetical protein
MDHDYVIAYRLSHVLVNLYILEEVVGHIAQRILGPREEPIN